MEHEFDSYSIDISNIKNSDKVCWQYTKEPPLEEEDWMETSGDVFYKLSATTEALAVAADFVHLTKITPTNILEWYYRVNALFDAGVGFIFVDTKEGEVPIRINIDDLKDHLGLRIDSQYWEGSKFDKSVRTIRMQQHIRNLLK